jgi:hypothetical protein
VLSGGVDVAKTRAKWLFTSFAVISSGDADVVKAQSESGFTLDGTIYRVEASFVGGSVVTQPSPEGPRFRLLRLNRETTFLVSASSTKLLRKRTTDAKWSVVTAE